MNKRLIKSNDEGGGASFNTVTYTAETTNGTYEITGVGFQPDFIWVKNRDNVENHYLIDSVRGLTNMTDKFLQSNTTNSESAASLFVNSLSEPNSTTVTAIDDGFRVVETTINSGEFYFNGRDYVAWCWKAGGAAVTNNDGTTPSQVSANVEAGFSIVTWTTNLSPATLRVGHGLGQTPDIVIFKRRSSPAEDWYILSNLFDGSYLLLNSTAGLQSLGSSYSTSVTDTLLTSFTGAIGIDYVAYCFAEVAGFSKFGSYEGTGNNGNFVSTSVDGDAGFEPAFLMVKRTENPDNWVIVDNKRGTSNSLFPDDSSQELSNSGAATFSSNGFTVNGASGGWNVLGETYIYMAFANQF